jgi:DNA-directed RNA polymerase subunit RPC12/RpoP
MAGRAQILLRPALCGGVEGKTGEKRAKLEQVRCLECGASYEKPNNGGTVRENPGCPECGYLGWARGDGSVSELQPRRFAAGRPRHRVD